MAGNILTDTAAAYSAITVLATNKVDNTARTDGEVATYAIAKWANEIDEALINISAWLTGETTAGITGQEVRLAGEFALLSANASLTLGNSAGTPTLVLAKSETGQARVDFKSATFLRWRLAADGGENLVIERYDGAGALVDTPLTIDDATGAITTTSTINGVTVETHASRHANAGADELSVAGLSGLLADAQTAIAAAGIDTTAIHDDAAGEISAITAKAVPTTADFLLIEDAAAGNVKKRITIGDLPSGGSGLTHPQVMARTMRA